MYRHNTTRLWLTVRKTVMEKRNGLLLTIAGVIGFNIIVGMWCGLVGGRLGEDTFVLYVFFSGLVCAVAASRMFGELSTTQGRISLLMTPATAAGMFVPRLIATVPGMVLLLAAGYIALEYSTVLAAKITYGVWFPVNNPLSASWGPDGAMLLNGLIAIFLINESFFIFGSIAWPRKSFLKTMGLFIAIQIVFSAACTQFFRSGWRIDIADGKLAGWIAIGIFYAIAVGITWLAYIRLKKTTVVSRF